MEFMSSPDGLIDDVNERLRTLFAQQRPRLEAISSELSPVLDHLIDFTAGGKRTRAEFVATGARMVNPEAAEQARAAIISAATALELFHAAALIHDDLIDRSYTRRGKPATHRFFAGLHQTSNWTGDADHFGVSGAILTGDLLLMWSDDLLAEALTHVSPVNAQAAATAFSRMRTEVTAGQYLDIVEENAWPLVDADKRLSRAIIVATSKSARYSVESPLLLGATLAGADEATLDLASRIGLPLGLAFQVRDDVLGVFGDSQITGKPSGDDLREGKRTVLIAELSGRVDEDTAQFFDTRLGQPDLSAEEITRMQQALRNSGALDAVEQRIQGWLDDAVSAIEGANLHPVDEQRFINLAQRIAQRNA